MLLVGATVLRGCQARRLPRSQKHRKNTGIMSVLGRELAALLEDFVGDILREIRSRSISEIEREAHRPSAAKLAPKHRGDGARVSPGVPKKSRTSSRTKRPLPKARQKASAPRKSRTREARDPESVRGGPDSSTFVTSPELLLLASGGEAHPALPATSKPPPPVRPEPTATLRSNEEVVRASGAGLVIRRKRGDGT